MPDPIAVNKSINAGAVREVDAAEPESIEGGDADALANAVAKLADDSVEIEAVVADVGAVIGQLEIVGDDVVIPDGGVTCENSL